MKTPILYTILYLFQFNLISAAQPAYWSEPVNVSNTDFGSFEPSMAMDANGHIHLVWTEQIEQYNIYKTEIYYSEFDGNLWTLPCQISSPETTWASAPRIAIDNDCNPHVIWLHRAIFPDNEIFYSSRINNVWTAPVNLTPDLGTSFNPDVAIDGQGNIHAFWVSYFDGLHKLIHKANENGTWQPYEVFDNDSLDFNEINFKIDSQDRIHICFSACPSLSYLDVYYLIKDGSIWGEPVKISDDSGISSLDPKIALDTDDNPHIVWQEVFSNQLYEVFYTRCEVASWLEDYQLTNYNTITEYPEITIDSDNKICVVFSSRVTAYNPFLLYLLNLDGNWTEPDSVVADYNGTFSTLICGQDDNYYLSFPTSFIYYSDIGFTCYIPDNSIHRQTQDESSNVDIKINPNPFNSIVNIEFNVIRRSNTKIYVYNIMGKLVKILFEADSYQGKSNTYWDGKDFSEKEVCSGIYFLTIVSADFKRTLKIGYIK